MKYLWTEDTGAGLHFWELVNQLFFDDAFVIESKGSNQDKGVWFTNECGPGAFLILQQIISLFTAKMNNI